MRTFYFYHVIFGFSQVMGVIQIIRPWLSIETHGDLGISQFKKPLQVYVHLYSLDFGCDHYCFDSGIHDHCDCASTHILIITRLMIMIIIIIIRVPHSWNASKTTGKETPPFGCTFWLPALHILPWSRSVHPGIMCWLLNPLNWSHLRQLSYPQPH